jgi:asparagine synthase (glutamine-hydrolysing)
VTCTSGDWWVGFVGRPYGIEAWDGQLERLDGQFALVALDTTGEQVIAATDPFGMQPLYVAERGGVYLVSTSALALAQAVQASPSEIGIKVFLRAGYVYGALTLWEGVCRLEPGQALLVDRDGARVTTYYRAAIDRAVGALGLERAVERSAEILVEACRTRLGGAPPIWADLTGGFDSRLLDLALAAADVPFRTNTSGSPDDPEVRLASAVARVAGWRWDRIDGSAVAEPPDRSWAEHGAAWGDGMLPMLQAGAVLAGHAVKARGPRRLVIGGAFEHARGAAWLQEFHRAGRTSVVNLDNWIRMRCLHPMDMRPFCSDFTVAVEADFRRRMTTWAEPYRDELNTVQLGAMLALRHTGHFGAWAAAARAHLDTEIPAYYRAVFENFFSIDPRWRSHHRLQRHLLDHLDPAVAALSTTNGGPGAPLRLGNAVRFAPVYGRLGRRAAVKLTERYRPPKGGRPRGSAAEPNRGAKRAMVEVDRLGLSTTNGRRELRLDQIVAAERLPSLLEAVVAGDVGALDCLDRILTVETALRLVRP